MRRLNIYHTNNIWSSRLSIDIIFIENGPVDFESIEDKERNIHLYIYLFINFLLIITAPVT